MFRGFYTAGSALVTNTNKLDVISNNISNVNSTGFKKDLVIYETFEDALISKVNGSFPAEGLQPFEKATVTANGDTFNVKLDGGYVRIQTPIGVNYGKEVNFAKGFDNKLRTYSRAEDGTVDTSYGYPVMGLKGPIEVGSGQLEVDESGNLLEDGKVLDKLVFEAPPHVIGTMNAGIKMERIETDFSQGTLQPTGNQLDFALQGKGFFTIETPAGTRYTRDGSFKINSESALVTSEGYPVVGTEGPIVIDGSVVASNDSGEILVDGELVNKFQIAAFENNRDLRKTGGGFFTFAEGLEPVETEFAGTVAQAQLEGANVDPVREMVEMMTLFRGYESSQRMVRAYDESIGKAVNEVGRV